MPHFYKATPRTKLQKLHRELSALMEEIRGRENSKNKHSHNDLVQEFITNRCYKHPEFYVKRRTLYWAYKLYVGFEKALSKNKFAQEMEKLGYTKQDRRDKHVFCGLLLK